MSNPIFAFWVHASSIRTRDHMSRCQAEVGSQRPQFLQYHYIAVPSGIVIQVKRKVHISIYNCDKKKLQLFQVPLDSRIIVTAACT